MSIQDLSGALDQLFTVERAFDGDACIFTIGDLKVTTVQPGKRKRVHTYSWEGEDFKLVEKDCAVLDRLEISHVEVADNQHARKCFGIMRIPLIYRQPDGDSLRGCLPLCNWWARHRAAMRLGMGLLVSEPRAGVGLAAQMEIFRRVTFDLTHPASTCICVDFADIPDMRALGENPDFKMGVLFVHHVTMDKGIAAVRALAAEVNRRYTKRLVTFIHCTGEASSHFSSLDDGAVVTFELLHQRGE